MLVAGFPAGAWAANCYVVAPGKGQECVIIDPGQDAARGVDDVIRENGLKPVAVLLTHGHLDHVWSVVPVCGAHDVPAYIHPSDRHLLTDPAAGLSAETTAMLQVIAESSGGSLEFSEPSDVRELGDGDTELSIAGLDLVIAHAPGHTRGSVVFRTPGGGEDPPVLFSGDLLFRGGVGRTDLAGGDHAALLASLQRVCLPLDDATVVLSGHGPETTIGHERAANPWLRELAAGSADLPAPPTRGQ